MYTLERANKYYEHRNQKRLARYQAKSDLIAYGRHKMRVLNGYSGISPMFASVMGGSSRRFGSQIPCGVADIDPVALKVQKAIQNADPIKSMRIKVAVMYFSGVNPNLICVLIGVKAGSVRKIAERGLDAFVSVIVD
jgi:hypothetical protein